MQPFTFFISYRRQDTAPIALLLKNELEKRLQFVRVVVDIEEMRSGEQFPVRLRQLIGEAHATIALIGRHWMPRRSVSGGSTSMPKDGKAFVKETDWVVAELECAALDPLAPPKDDNYGRERRALIPLFVDCEPGFEQFAIPATISFLTQQHAERIYSANWPMAIGPLVERIAVSLKLKKRPDGDTYPQPDVAKARTQAIGDQELSAILRYDDYEGWYIDNFGDAEVRYLAKTYRFPHFDEAADFMALVSNHCSVLNHHPEWRNVFNHVTVSLTTWDARRRVTIYDLNLALFMNKAAAAVLEGSAK